MTSFRMSGSPAPSRASHSGASHLKHTKSHALRSSLGLIAAAAFITACADSASTGPKLSSGNGTTADISAVEAQAALPGRFPDLGNCTQLQVPEGSHVSFHAFGVGFQV